MVQGVGRVQPGAVSAPRVGGDLGATVSQKRQDTIALIPPDEAFKTVETIQNLLNGLGALGGLLPHVLRMFGGGASDFEVLRAKGDIPAWLGKDEFVQGLSAIRETGVRPKDFLALGVEARGQFLRTAADFYRTWKDGRMPGRSLEHNMRELVASTEAGEEWRKTPGLNPLEVGILEEAFTLYKVTDPEARNQAAKDVASGRKTAREAIARLAENGATTGGGGRLRPPGQIVATDDWPEPGSDADLAYRRFFELSKNWGWQIQDIPSWVEDPRRYFSVMTYEEVRAEFAKRNGTKPYDFLSAHDALDHLLQPGNEKSYEQNFSDLVTVVRMKIERHDWDRVRIKKWALKTIGADPDSMYKDVFTSSALDYILAALEAQAALNKMSVPEFLRALDDPERARGLKFQRLPYHPLQARPR